MTDFYCELESPIRTLTLVGTASALTAIHFANTGFVPGAGLVADREPFREPIAQLSAYFRGELREFDLALEPRGTAFQREVWAALREIPWGTTISYGELANRIGRPNASRAVGAANGQNPIPIVIPCHRVIGKDGSLTGFGGGLATKRRLLEIEGIATGDQTELFRER